MLSQFDRKIQTIGAMLAILGIFTGYSAVFGAEGTPSTSPKFTFIGTLDEGSRSTATPIGPRAAGLTIVPTFDSSITSDPRAADIMATINSAIAVYAANFSDPVTVAITFKQISTGLGQSNTFINKFNYTDYRAALVSHAKSADDTLALANLPSTTNNPVTNDPQMLIPLALARALGFNANPSGGVDSTISLNIALTNITAADKDGTKYSLFAVASHEMDEALGLGSALNFFNNGSAIPTTVYPEDLFRYDSTGARTFVTTSTATSFFSIDGKTNLAQFNQRAGGDFSDWFSPGGQTPQVQDAFASPGATPVLGVELRALDVAGYTRISAPSGGPSLPNLTLDSAGGMTGPAEARTGTNVTFSASVINNGTAAAGPFNVHFVLSAKSTIDATAIDMGDAPITGLAVNATTKAAFTGTLPTMPAGKYNLFVVIDSKNQVTESNESDNTFSAPAQMNVTVNHPPVISSPASFLPNPATINQQVTFSVGATDADNDPLNIAWDFGDGSSGTGATATHTYTTAQAFTATATVSDGFGGTVTSTVTVNVFFPVFKSPNQKQKFMLNFKTNKDSIDITMANSQFANFMNPSASTTIALVIGDIFSGKGVLVDKGPIAKGKATGSVGKFTLNAHAGTARYMATNTSLQTLLAQFGATNSPISKNISVPIYFFISNTAFFGDTYSFFYVGKVDKSGVGN